MKTLIEPFVRKVLAIHPDDRVSNQEILVTLFAFSFIALLFGLIANSLIILGL